MADGSANSAASPPPPPYSTDSLYEHTSHPQQLTNTTASHISSMFTPPLVSNSLHAAPTYQSGPTPPQQLHLPYAYYDPHSQYSVALADSRARTRFGGALLYATGVLVLLAVAARWWGSGWMVLRIVDD